MEGYGGRDGERKVYVTRDKKKIKKLFVSGEAFFMGEGCGRSERFYSCALREDYMLFSCFFILTFFDALLLSC